MCGGGFGGGEGEALEAVMVQGQKLRHLNYWRG